MAIFGTLGENDLSAISASIADTAVDVFVYDTRKDSDGGAWRKRTQTTSWYNETLNTSTRGSRKEFPAVAVIVAESTQITIYDGDDPDLPMWMVFNQGSSDGQNRILNRFMGNLKSVSMLNGNLTIFGNSTSSADRGGGVWINFISEVSYAFGSSDAQGENIYGTLLHNIAQRNTILGTDLYADNDSKYQLVDNSQCNDVAMTVLPNAPVDDTTGLSVPTIAVATAGGVSVIKDDGTVVDITSSKAVNDVKLVHFDKSGRLYFAAQSSSSITDVYQFDRYTIPSADTSNNVYSDNSDAAYYPADTSGASFQDVRPNFNAQYNDGINEDITSIVSNNDGGIVGNVNGLSLFAENYSTQGNGMVAYAATSYNTGYMHGDCKGAFLSDTYTDADFGPEMVTGGDFSNAGDWSFSANPSWSINGSGQLVHNGGAADSVLQAGSFTQGKYYQLTADLVSGNAGSFGVTAHHNTSELQPHNQSPYMDVYCVGNVGGKIYAMWKQSGANLNSINLYANAAITIDNVSIKEISRFYYDRSVNNKPLALIGSLTKTPVATGADLVAYSGFSNSDYLTQSYNSDMQTGTGDFSVTCWFKTTSTENSYEGLVYYNTLGSTDGGWQIMMGDTSGNKGIYLYVKDDSTPSTTVYSDYIPGFNDGSWHCVVATHTSSQIQVYIDGTLKKTVAHSIGSISNSNARLTVGRWYGNANSSNYWWRGSLALVKHSASVPSPEQVKKMYEDEKVLFQENAKATLYGSSDAVTALEFDDTTNLLHVGTSAGRSEFQGLRRINNTTDAVTAAISASNGLVAEQ